MEKTNKEVWYGILYSDEEIDSLMEPIINKYINKGSEKTSKKNIAEDISETFGIPAVVAEAFLTIAHTAYADDYYTVLVDIKDLMKTKMNYSVYNSLKAYGIEETAENARKHVQGMI